jgi:hypothetical protein
MLGLCEVVTEMQQFLRKKIEFDYFFLIKKVWSPIALFFEKSIEYIKSAEGRNPWYTGSIQRGLGGRGEIREKIRKTNYLWGQPPLSPSEESKEEQMEEFLMGS